MTGIDHGATVLVHIGKCGGRALRNGLANATRNGRVHVVHIERPPYRPDLKYIVVARGPIPRLMSAFRWRYKLVVARGTQRKRFPGEFEVLARYERLNSLAEALYQTDGRPNRAVHEEIRRIHHIREDIAFYLEPLLDRCDPAQVVAVLMQESLDEDIHRVFGYRNELSSHHNPPRDGEDELSPLGLSNLKRFFHRDFEALTRLHCWGKIDETAFVRAVTHEGR